MQIYEDNPGYELAAQSLSISYNIIGADGLDYWSVRSALLNFVPKSNSPPEALWQWPRRGIDLNEVGPGIWKAKVQWGSLNNQYAIKIGGSSQQIRCDKSLFGLYSAPGKTPLTWAAQGKKGVAIGFDGQTVQGCSIYAPTRSWTEGVEIPVSQYTFDYEDRVAQINLAPVNFSSFRGFAAGQVRFNGMQGQLSANNPEFVSATFEFEAGVNNSQSNGNLLTIGAIENIAKDAWDYLDVVYEKSVDTTAMKTYPSPSYVLIHRVYDRSDFAALNIGTGEALPAWQG